MRSSTATTWPRRTALATESPSVGSTSLFMLRRTDSPPSLRAANASARHSSKTSATLAGVTVRTTNGASKSGAGDRALPSGDTQPGGVDGAFAGTEVTDEAGACCSARAAAMPVTGSASSLRRTRSAFWRISASVRSGQVPIFRSRWRPGSPTRTEKSTTTRRTGRGSMRTQPDSPVGSLNRRPISASVRRSSSRFESMDAIPAGARQGVFALLPGSRETASADRAAC